MIRQTISVFNVGIINSVSHHIHCANTEHCSIHIVPIEHMVVVVVFLFSVIEDIVLVFSLEIFTRSNKESRSTTCRITDCIIGFGVKHLYHHANDVARRSKLTVYARGCKFGEQTLVNIALGVCFNFFCHLLIHLINCINNF